MTDSLQIASIEQGTSMPGFTRRSGPLLTGIADLERVLERTEINSVNGIIVFSDRRGEMRNNLDERDE